MPGDAARIEFEAVLEAAPGGGALVRLPADAAAVFGTRARFPVRATFDGVPYRGSTMPMGDGTFCLGVLKSIRQKAGMAIGATISVVVERDDVERSVAVPDELATALQGDAAAKAAFEGLSYSHQREHARYVAEAKKPETRQARAHRVVEIVRPT